MTGRTQAKRLEDGIVAGRLGAAEVRDNFQDLHPPLDPHEALVAAEEVVYGADKFEAEASVKEVEAAVEAGAEGDDEGSESDGSDFSLPSLYKPPTPTGLNTL